MIFTDRDTGELSPFKCLEEVDAAMRVTRSYMATGIDQMRRYVGPYYTQESAGTQPFPENHYLSYVSLVPPKIIYRNPRVRATTVRGGGAKMASMALERGLNRWIRDNNLRRFLLAPVVDMLFGWGIALTANEPLEAHEPIELPGGRKIKTPFMPRTYRISPSDFFQDPGARCETELRYRGHLIRRDKADLVAEAEADSTWNLDAVRMLEASGEIDTYERGDGAVPFRKGGMNRVDRDQVEYYEIWVPELGVDDGDTRYNGKLLTVSRVMGPDGKSTSKWLREPRDYYGPKTGPYAVFGCYYASDSALPLAPLPAIEDQIQSLNALRIAADNADRMYKRMVFVPDVDPELADKIKHAETDTVMALKNLDVQGAKIFQAEVGGASPQLREAVEIHRRALFEISGMDDAQRGSVTGAGTATEHQIADASAAARLDFIRQRFQDGVDTILRTVAWYLYHDTNIAFPVEGDEDTLEVGAEAWFQGGSDSEDGYSFDDMELEIEPYSMERTNEALNQERAVQVMNMSMQLIPVMAQFPDAADYIGLMNAFGDSMNVPNAGEFLNPEAAAAAMQQQAQPSQAPPKPQLVAAQSNRPRLTAGRPSTTKKPVPQGGQGAQQKPAVKQVARIA